MRKRLTVLAAVVALLVVGTVPASAAPGGVPGPPDGHGRSADDGGTVESDGDVGGVPDWAKAYGKRIKDEFGMTYGHLQQCARAAAEDGVDGDAALESDESLDDDNSKKFLEDCPVGPDDMPVYPEDERGAKAFALANGLFVLTESDMLIVGM